MKPALTKPTVDPLARPRPDTSGLQDGLRQDADATFEYADAAKAKSTNETYSAAWERFKRWAGQYGLPVLPATPESVMTYAGHLARTGRAFATIEIAVAAIGAVHRVQGVEPNPVRFDRVREVLHGIARTIGTNQKQKAHLTPENLRAMLAKIPPGMIGVRDRALLLLWWNCASRRSEPVSLQIEDVTFDAEGLRVNFRRTKTDQTGKGLDKGVPYAAHADRCAVRALRTWLDELAKQGHSSGPLFREIRNVVWIGMDALAPVSAVKRIKRYARLAGIDPALVSGHSMRSGFATAAAKRGKPLETIKAQTGHKSTDMVLRYIRTGRLIRESAAAGLLDD